MAFENDPRTWSFAKRALAELKKSNKRKKKKLWRCWVQVQLAGGERHWYQLPKDLQAAVKAERKTHAKNWQAFLQGAVINVPIGEYHEGEAPITCGLICQVKMRHHKRSQVTMLPGANLSNQLIFLAGPGTINWLTIWNMISHQKINTGLNMTSAGF